MLKIVIYSSLLFTIMYKIMDNLDIAEKSQVITSLKGAERFESSFQDSSHFQHSSKTRLNISEMKVGIIGAGISGLYAAVLLQDLGVNYEILEASNRIGGRFYTYYFDKTFGNNYVELGAMRFPLIPIYNRLIGHQNLSLISYLNWKMKSNKKLKLIPFITETANDIFYFNGRRKYRSEVESNGDLFGFGKKEGGFIDDKFTSRNALFWNRKVFEYIQQRFSSNLSEGYKFLLNNDHLTFRGFLMDPNNPDFAYPSEVVDWMEDIFTFTGSYSASLMDIYLDYSIITNSMVTIEGGVSKLIQSINSILQNKPKLNQKVRVINERENNDLLVETNCCQFQYSHLIMTPTFKVIKDIEFQLNLHIKKRIAMRNIQNVNCFKIGIEFKSRFWENATLMNGKPLFGGRCATDLNIRLVIYPSQDINCTKCKGSLVIYTLLRNAEKFTSFSYEEIIDLCLKDLSVIHGEIVFTQFTGNYKIMDWSNNKWTQGSFSLFEPGYFRSYYTYLIQPEVNGRLHFAGDTVSLHHFWSIGALTAAYRAVKDILRIEGLNDKLKHLESKWGKFDEPDFSNIQ